jgi:hypothetical protein
MELFGEGQSESPKMRADGQPGSYSGTGGVYGYGGMGGQAKGEAQGQEKAKAGQGTSSEEDQSAFIKRIKNFVYMKIVSVFDS